MKIKDLLAKLETYNPEDEIYISGDPEGNDIRTIDEIYMTEIPKSNNVGTYDAVVIYPTDNKIRPLREINIGEKKPDEDEWVYNWKPND